jgi:hypothetical protein
MPLAVLKNNFKSLITVRHTSFAERAILDANNSANPKLLVLYYMAALIHLAPRFFVYAFERLVERAGRKTRRRGRIFVVAYFANDVRVRVQREHFLT